jgi:Polyketide cyclase / dehydrase and lipid transport
MDCRREEIGFLERAPYRFENEGLMPVSAERLFEVLADAPGWPHWFVDMLEAHWTCSPPFGVGSTRTVRLKPMSVDETILVWEPGKRFSFRLDRVGLPLVKAMVEDYQIEALGPASCKLRAVQAYEPSLLTTALHPVVRAVLGSQFRRTVQQLAKYLAA